MATVEGVCLLPRPMTIELSADDVRNGRVLDRALVEVDRVMDLARSKADPA